ncbi:MAG: hypothetical protein AAF430_18430 [Myxococcota bacterium]
MIWDAQGTFEVVDDEIHYVFDHGYAQVGDDRKDLSSDDPIRISQKLVVGRGAPVLGDLLEADHSGSRVDLASPGVPWRRVPGIGAIPQEPPECR